MHLLGGPVDALLASHLRNPARHDDGDDGDNSSDGDGDGEGDVVDGGAVAGRGSARASLEARVAALEDEVRRLRGLLEPGDA